MTERGKSAVMADAVREAAQEFSAQRDAAAGEQLDMLPASTRFRGKRADAVQQAVRREGQRGRPPGATNLATEEFRKFLFGKGVNPLVAIARYAVMPPHLLAQELDCTLLEAFDRFMELQEALAPYLHQQMPRALDLGGATAGLLILGDISAAQRGQIEKDYGISALQLSADQYQEKQVVSEGEGATSHDERRTGEDK